MEAIRQLHQLADLLRLSARSIRWIARHDWRGRQGSRLIQVAADLDEVAAAIDAEAGSARTENARLN